MGGIYISCGSFRGEDKSASSIEAVLRELGVLEGALIKPLVDDIGRRFDGPADYAIIDTEEAERLLPFVRVYRAGMEERIAPLRDPWDQIAKDHSDDPGLDATDAKCGKSLGWRYYCSIDLEKACEASIAGREPIILNWD
jgi:hypothetical protein